MGLMKRIFAAIAVTTGILCFFPSASFAYIYAGNMEQQAVMEPGTILIASDSHIEKLPDLDVRFGHAAIVGPEGTTVIQAIGREYNGKLLYSEEVPIQQFFEHNPHWKAYVVTNATPEQKYAAAQYARDHLLGKEYPKTTEILYAKGDPYKLYCSSLVWKAWKQVGYDLDYDDGGTESYASPAIQFLINVTHPWRPEALELLSPTKVDTVFPAEIAQDPALTMVAQGEDNGLAPALAEFFDQGLLKKN